MKIKKIFFLTSLSYNVNVYANVIVNAKSQAIIIDEENTKIHIFRKS